MFAYSNSSQKPLEAKQHQEFAFEMTHHPREINNGFPTPNITLSN
jgi:hypothetical protein